MRRASLDKAILRARGSDANGISWRRRHLHPNRTTVFDGVMVPDGLNWERVGMAERATWDGLLAEGVVLDTRMRFLLDQRDALADHMNAFLDEYRDALRERSVGVTTEDGEFEQDLRELVEDSLEAGDDAFSWDGNEE